MKSYEYDVFLSFTGIDREIKNKIYEHLSPTLKCYDSDRECMGGFREDFSKALDQSQVYLLILSDNLRNDPALSGKGTLSEVRRECSLACELEARNELNIVILCMSEFFRYDKPFHDYTDQLGWFFYSHTRGFSQIRGSVDEDGALDEKTLNEIHRQCSAFVIHRQNGSPIISQTPHIDIANERLVERNIFVGREDMIDSALERFKQGDRALILSGLGGIGKTTLATEIARKCEELNFLRCPQIAHVSEGTDRETKGLQAVVSAVRYTDSVYSSLEALAQSDKYERKLSVLASLPETVLLVIDNHNSLTSDDVSELLQKLKCRLLITTRAQLNNTVSGSSSLSVAPLDLDRAYELFCRISASEPDRTRFDGLYSSVGGHTITLCIMAKLMAVHKLSLEELIAQMGELKSFDARVDFRHNEYGDSDTVLGHLEKLFSISSFSEGSLRILRSMSILGSGTLPLNDLMSILGLRNRNEIIELTSNGWLEILEKEEDGGTREYLYLHPILSRLMASKLDPREENVSEMVSYLTGILDRARDNITYADASELENELYYACCVLAKSSGRLPHDLWAGFIELNHLLGNTDATIKRTTALAEHINSEEDRSLISSYTDMITLEHYPMRADILEKYIVTLDQNARDYKWVMRSLSVMLNHVRQSKKYRPFIVQSVEKAIDAAIANRDDVALMDLTVYILLLKNAKAVSHKLYTYIRKRRKAGINSGALLQIELILTAISIYSLGGEGDFMAKLGEAMNMILNDDFSSILKMLFRHPIAYSRTLKILKRIDQLDPDDPMAIPLKVAVGEAERLTIDRQIDASSMIEAAVQIYRLRIENHTTLVSAEGSIAGVINILHLFPEDSIRKGTGLLMERVDASNPSLQNLSNLQVAMLINREFGFRDAIDQARQVISVMRRLYPDGHTNVTSALLSYAEICATFGESKAALQAYVEVFRQTKISAPESDSLGIIAGRILDLPEASNLSVEVLTQIRDTALSALGENDPNYYWTLNNFGARLLEKSRSGDIPYTHPLYDELLNGWCSGVAQRDRLDLTAQISLIRSINNTANLLINHKQFANAEALCRLLVPFKSCRKKTARNQAIIYERSIIFYSAYHQNDDSLIELGERVIEECIRRKTLQSVASITVWLIVSYLCNKRTLPFNRLIKDNALLTRIASRQKLFLDSCVDMTLLNLSEEQYGSVSESILIECLKKSTLEIHSNDMNITAREFTKFKSKEQYYERVFLNNLDFLIEKHTNAPIALRPRT